MQVKVTRLEVTVPYNVELRNGRIMIEPNTTDDERNKGREKTTTEILDAFLAPYWNILTMDSELRPRKHLGKAGRHI